jgi:hypothetical protein
MGLGKKAKRGTTDRQSGSFPASEIRYNPQTRDLSLAQTFNTLLIKISEPPRSGKQTTPLNTLATRVQRTCIGVPLLAKKNDGCSIHRRKKIPTSFG